MRRHTKFLGGLKNRGGKAFRGPVTEGCHLVDLNNPRILMTHDKTAVTTNKGHKQSRVSKPVLKPVPWFIYIEKYIDI